MKPRINRRDPQSNSQSIKLQDSSMAAKPNLSKYKFIPPSKFFNSKNPNSETHNSTNDSKHLSEIDQATKQNLNRFKIKKKSYHYQSLTQPDMPSSDDQPIDLHTNTDEIASPLKANHNFNKKKKRFELCSSLSNKCLQNYDNIISKNRQNDITHNNVGHKQMFRSISGTKIDESTCSQYKNKSSKNASLKEGRQGISINEKNHIQKLTRFINQLKSKQEDYLEEIQTLELKNKKLASRLNEVEVLKDELQAKDNVIQQLNEKIQQYHSKSQEKCHQHSLIIDSLKKIIYSQKTKIIEFQAHFNVLPHSSATKDSQFDQSDDNPNLIQPPQQKGMVSNISQHHLQESLTSNLKSITPSFGNGTPDRADDQTIWNNGEVQEIEDEEYENKYYLSRISESAQSEQSSLGDNITRNQPYQHQQLLSEIDHYLAKWNKNK